MQEIDLDFEQWKHEDEFMYRKFSKRQFRLMVFDLLLIGSLAWWGFWFLAKNPKLVIFTILLVSAIMRIGNFVNSQSAYLTGSAYRGLSLITYFTRKLKELGRR